MTSSQYANAPWSLTRHSSEVTDILRREFESRAASDPDAMYDPRPISELHAALNRALALDDASKQAVRSILGKHEINELLSHEFGVRDGSVIPVDDESGTEK
jgi:hypothetical protein